MWWHACSPSYSGDWVLAGRFLEPMELRASLGNIGRLHLFKKKKRKKNQLVHHILPPARIHSAIQSVRQPSIDYLLHTRHCARHWECKDERWSLSSQILQSILGSTKWEAVRSVLLRSCPKKSQERHQVTWKESRGKEGDLQRRVQVCFRACAKET
jgi:hypothetical protein